MENLLQDLRYPARTLDGERKKLDGPTGPSFVN